MLYGFKKLKMKYLKDYILGIVLITFFIDGSAQTSLKYTYDASGYRTEKALWINNQKKSEKATDDSSTKNKQEIVEELLEETKISIYPNPTEGSLRVDFENLPEDSQSTISVYDMNGRAILNMKHLSSTNLVDLTHQPSGTYLLIISIGDNNTRWKVMKQ